MRVPLLSDIHSNLAALDAVLVDAAGAGADAAPWVLGDIVGYGPDPNEVIDRLRSLDAVSIAGNHDLAAAGLIATSEFNPLAAAAVKWTAGVIDDGSRDYLGSLPSKIERGRYTLVHGSPRDPVWEYLTSADALTENLQYFSTQACLFGHTHVPMVVAVAGMELSLVAIETERPVSLEGDRLFLNPGSVGQPRDGDPRASYVVLDTDKNTAEFRRVEYDFAATQERMRRAKLPNPLISRLAFGR